MDSPLFFDADGRFLSVELAAQHAVMVQGGFTTPRIEAERMTRSRDEAEAAMGREWLERNRTADPTWTLVLDAMRRRSAS